MENRGVSNYCHEKEREGERERGSEGIVQDFQQKCFTEEFDERRDQHCPSSLHKNISKNDTNKTSWS